MPTTRDEDRVDRIRRFLDELGLDAIACALPSHVLLFSGYWSVVGDALILASRQDTGLPDAIQLTARPPSGGIDA